MLFCLMDVWFMARNYRFLKLELTVASVGTTGYHCKESPVPEVGTRGSQNWNQRLLLQATAGYQRLELILPNVGTIGKPLQRTSIPKGWN